MKHFRRHLGSGFLALVFLFFYLPILSVVVYSFNESAVASEWTRFSAQWYLKLLDDTEILDSCRSSLILAVATA